jgi:hypothetical protein
MLLYERNIFSMTNADPTIYKKKGLDLVNEYFSFQAVKIMSAIHDQGRYFYSFITKRAR